MFRRPYDRRALTALLALGLLGPAAGSLAQDEAPGSGNPSLAAFEDLQAHIAREVEEGRLPAGAGEQAEEIGFALAKELIRAGADIEVFTLEVKRFTGERQEAALVRLVDAVAARERQIFHHLRRLEEVAGVSAPAPVVADIGKKTKKKEGGIEIDSTPEDLSKDPKWPL